MALAGAEAAPLDGAFTALEAEAADWFAQEAVSAEDRSTRRVALMRYEEQGHELPIPWPALGDIAVLGRDFAAAHRGLYGFDLPDVAIEIVTLRVEAAGALPTPAASRPQGGGAEAAVTGRQTIRLPAGPVDAPIIDRALLGPGAHFAGPAIVTQLDATTLVAPGWQARMDASGALLLTR